MVACTLLGAVKGNGATYTFSGVTVAGANPLLLIAAEYSYRGYINNSPMLDGATPFTFVNRRSIGMVRMEFWYYPNPPAGIHNVTVAYSTTLVYAVGLLLFTGVNLTTPFRINEFNQVTGTPISVSINNTAADDLIFAHVAVSGPDSFTQSYPEQTEHWDLYTDYGVGLYRLTGMGCTRAGAAPPVTLGWTAIQIALNNLVHTISVIAAAGGEAVSATNSMATEALADVSAPQSAAVEVLVPVEGGVIGNLEALGPAIVSYDLGTEALVSLAQSQSAVAEALAPIQYSGSLTTEALKPISGSRILSLETLLSVARSTAVPTEALLRLQRLAPILMEAEGVVTYVFASNDIPLEAIAALSVSQTLTAEALSAPSRSINIPAESILSLAVQSSPALEALVLVSPVQAVASLEVVKAIVGSRTLTVEALGRVQKYTDIPLEARALVSASGVIALEARGGVTVATWLPVGALSTSDTTAILPTRIDASGYVGIYFRLAVVLWSADPQSVAKARLAYSDDGVTWTEVPGSEVSSTVGTSTPALYISSPFQLSGSHLYVTQITGVSGKTVTTGRGELVGTPT
jgi:hypothetical protein